MGTIPPVPVFPAGRAATGAAMQALATATTYVLSGKPEAQLTQNATQSLTNSTQTAIAWQSKITDRDGGWSSGSNTRYTAQTRGLYQLAACICYAANATGSREAMFRITTGANNPAGAGVTTTFGFTSLPPSSGVTAVPAASLTPQLMYVADYVEVLGWQNSGGALSTTLTGAQGPSFFTIALASG